MAFTAFVISPTITSRQFHGHTLTTPHPTNQPTTPKMTASRAIPFLEAPPKLDGTMVGDVGFDPLGLSNYINLNYARAGELKNGRIAMLACLGMVVQELIQLPGGQAFAEKNPLKAIYSVPVEGWCQILLTISIVELVTFRQTYEGEPGDYGFDPLGYSKGKDMRTLKLKEIKNARLAMIGVMGFIVQTFVFNKPIISQLTTYTSPVNFTAPI